MRLSGAKTILHIAEVNEIEREMLKALGFLKSGESDSCEYWEYSINFSQENEVTYQEIGSNLILGSDGSVFIKLQNGYYMDKFKNEYRYDNRKLIPVLIQNNHLPETSEFEITDAEYHDELGKEKTYRDYEVKITENRYVLIRVYDKTGLIYTVQNEDGSKVYDYDGNYFSESFDEEKIFSFVKEHYDREEKDMPWISDWKNWKVGRKTVYKTHEFDGNSRAEGVITEVHKDHLICEAEGMKLWIDDDTADMFS